MNMSYCMFQNTATDLRQCLESMDEADTLSELFLFQSRDEKRSYDLMREYCQNFLDIAHRLDAAQQDDDDGQPDEAQEWADFDADC